MLYPSASAHHRRADYLSGSDEIRARDVEDAWCDPEIAGIFVLRGGYGTVRILDRLDAVRMRAAAPKPLYGSSDLTALHEWLAEQLGVPSWFTPMIGTRSALDDEAALTSLRAAVCDGLTGRRWSAAAAEVLVPGVAAGRLIGGNLSLLAMTLGARRAGSLRPPRHRRPAGGCHRGRLPPGRLPDQSCCGPAGSTVSSGIALGSWQDCGPWPPIRDLCLELLGPLGVPMVGELGFGHGPAAHSLPLGRQATLRAVADPLPELIIDDPASTTQLIPGR